MIELDLRPIQAIHIGPRRAKFRSKSWPGFNQGKVTLLAAVVDREDEEEQGGDCSGNHAQGLVRESNSKAVEKTIEKSQKKGNRHKGDGSKGSSDEGREERREDRLGPAAMTPSQNDEEREGSDTDENKQT